MPYYSRRELFAGNGSDLTSGAHNVEGMDQISVQIVGAGTLTLQGSNDNGRTAAIANWSEITSGVSSTAGGLLTVEPGFSWVRGIRSGNTLAVTVGGWRDMG